MFIQGKIEDAAAAVISASFAAHNVTNWQINKGLDTHVNTFPSVKVICHNFEPAYKELNIGTGRAHLEIVTCGIKAIGDAGQGTAATEFETVSDLAFNPFLANNIATTLAGYATNLQFLLVSDEGLDVSTLTDGWIASQKYEIVCARTS